MDRREAYGLLTAEMEALTRLSAEEAARRCGETVEVDRTGPCGTLYRIELTVEPAAAGRFAVIGKIHDNSPVRFELLEERLEFAPGKGA